MSLVHGQNAAPCRFRGEHPTVARPASRIPLMTAAARTRTGVLCMATARGLRASLIMAVTIVWLTESPARLRMTEPSSFR